MARNIEPGTLVIDESGHEYVYGGTSDMDGMMQVTFGIGSGKPATIRTDMDQVAPASVAATVNLKDGRILVQKMDNKPRYASGPWRHLIVLPDGTTHTGWHKTKRDGTSEAAHRLAIAEWHAAPATTESRQGMKFYKAVTKVPLVLECILTNKGKHTFPAGTEVSATESGPERWHLNAELDGEYYDGHAATVELEVGAVIATANEPAGA